MFFSKHYFKVFLIVTLLISLLGSLFMSVPVSAQSGTCSPVSATITAPFSFDGAGTRCWQSNNLGGYINSWNLTSLTINGVNITNIYVASGSYPAQIGGYWYISYNGAYAWSHFEAAGTGGPVATATRTNTPSGPTNTPVSTATATRTNTPGSPINTATRTNTPSNPVNTPTRTATPTTTNGTNPSAGCGKTRTLQNGTITIQSNGARQYILRVPDNYSNTRAYRLIVAYHWLNGSAQEVANGGSWASETPYYGLWNLANNSTIFVAPVGLNAGWANTNGQDVTFTDAILSQVKSELCIDQSRIFANGFSYGAGMSYAIACARANVFRGVALYAGAQLSGCSGGTTPIAYFAAHGLSDSVLSIANGRTLRNRFVTLNGVTAQNPPEPAVGSGTHICTKYSGGSPSYPVTWCAFDGDHNPNPHDRGQGTSWVPQEVWNFIIQF